MLKLISDFIDYTSPAFTPLSIIVIGSHLADLSLKNIKLPKALWASLLFRNILFPIGGTMILVIMRISGIPLFTTVILSGCPVAGIMALFVLQSNGDARPATVLMSISTILSLAIIPLVYWFASLW